MFGAASTKEAKYQLIYQDKPFSVRKYQPVMIAEVTIQGKTYSDISGKAFSMLFQYISGQNSAKDKISMTTPVVIQPKNTGQKISMTAPVLINSQAKDIWTMSFILPSTYTPETTPKPLNPLIKIYQRPKMEFAVVRFRGRLSEESKRIQNKKLRAWAKSAGYNLAGEPL